MAELDERQYALGDGIVFGHATPYVVNSSDFGAADIRSVDAARAYEDGERFGRDHRSGRTVAFEITILARGSALPELDALTSAWLADETRLVAGAVLPLRMRRGGRSRRVYGRPRRFAAGSASTLRGLIPVTCDFRAIDHLFYEDTESAVTFGIVPDPVGGLVGPLIGPLVASGTGEGAQAITVGGTEAAWLISRIDGPITNPTIEVIDQWSITLDLTLAADQWLLIDPSPWGRTVRRNDAANLAGAFTADSRRLTGMRVPPGRHQVVLRGTDPTGTAALSLFWRAAYSSF